MIIIAESTTNEAGDLLALQKLAYQSEAKLYNDWSLPALTQTLDSLLAEYANSLVLTARLEDEIIGSVRGTLFGDTCKIGRLVVHPNMQRQGIGTKLLTEIEQRFFGCARYELFTGGKSEANIRLYQRNGYTITQTQLFSPSIALTFLEKRGL